jgi:hypothetical protein
MSKALIVVDFAYKGPKRTGRGTGAKGLHRTLRYFQYRDAANNRQAQNHDYERWHDRGLGLHYRAIYERCLDLQSRHVLAWTWVISPAPDLMALIPEVERRALLAELTERIVEDYYAARGLDTPEYAYVVHRRMTEPEDEATPQEHLHTHVVLPGTAPGLASRVPVYNNTSKGHDTLFREIAAQQFAQLLDEHGLDWRVQRDWLPERDIPPSAPDIDVFA